MYTFNTILNLPFAFLLLSLLDLLPTTAAAINNLTEIPFSEFGPNPSNVTFNLYLPSKLAPNPPILVNPHWCHGSALAAFTGTQLATLADTYGYIMIFPSSPNTVDYCWDVSSPSSLTHNSGGDSLGIVSMVKYTIEKYNADPRRVFAMGTLSGAMMTNVLLGAYPDVFAAGSAWAGVALGCFADSGGGVDVWNSACAEGEVIKTGAEWKAIVQAAYPGYSGWRPKMQVFHGSVDTTLYPQNLEEEIKEWTAVLGLEITAMNVLADQPQMGWTTYVFGDGERFRATNASGITHNIQTNETVVLDWFDLRCQGEGCFSKPVEGGKSGASKWGRLLYPFLVKSV